METRRDNFGVAVVTDSAGGSAVMYAVGGFGGLSNSPLKTVESLALH